MTPMRPTLILQPIHSSSSDIMRCFALAKPLSSDQRNFLEWHQRQLSSAAFDPVYRYYIEAAKKQHARSFLLPSDLINVQSLEQFKKRLKLFIQKKLSAITFTFTETQFAKFEELNMSELIFWHGNQLLSGAPFYPGGIPPVIYFQWGNYFGVAKYVMLAGEKALKANILVYFEDRQERDLDQCVADYQKKNQLALQNQHTILHQHELEPEHYDKFLIKTPTLDRIHRSA